MVTIVAMHAEGLESGIAAKRAYRMSLKGGLKSSLLKADWVFDRRNIKSVTPITAITRSLRTYAYPYEASFANRAINKRYYNVPGLNTNALGALGDDQYAYQGQPGWNPETGQTDYNPGSTASPDRSDWGAWSGVLSSFLAPIGAGFGRLIKQGPSTVFQQGPGAVSEPVPGWVVPVAVGGGGLMLYLLLRK